ncbi:MAG: YraN family protein [Clostridia bacterium]|nr:YraN family protein [Clostridia bacterium]
MNNRSFGKKGEDVAASYLREHGYEIVGQNVYVGHDEIDILSADDTHILFTEVKTRRERPEHPDRFGRPAAAVTPVKQKHLLASAGAWLHEHAEEIHGRQPRIDVIEVYISPDDGSVLRVFHIENAVRKK